MNIEVTPLQMSNQAIAFHSCDIEKLQLNPSRLKKRGHCPWESSFAVQKAPFCVRKSLETARAPAVPSSLGNQSSTDAVKRSRRRPFVGPENNDQQKPSVVTFDRLVQWHTVESVKEYPLWYAPAELKQIKGRVKRTVRIIRSGANTMDLESIGLCGRGLEYKLPDSGSQRNEQLHRALDAVLRTQIILTREGITDMSQETSRVYSNETRSDKLEAYKRGLLDSKEATTPPVSKSKARSTRDEAPKVPSRGCGSFGAREQ
jgi:hypothetical protein